MELACVTANIMVLCYMVPPFTKSDTDKHDWEKFIDAVKSHYQDDERVEIKSHYIEFDAGEHPLLPFEGHKFLRFSSKITGPTAAATGVEDYIRTLSRIATDHFGSRVEYWNELYERYGHYGWDEVHESERLYTKVRQHPWTPLLLRTFADHAVDSRTNLK